MPSCPDRARQHKPHPVTRAEFARRAGKGRSTVTEACAGPLAPASLPGGRIDARHPAVVEWATARGIDPAVLLGPAVSTQTPAGARPEPGPTLGPLADPIDVSSLVDKTIREVTDEYGSVLGVADWLDVRKTAAEIIRIETQNAERAGLLIERERVRTHVFGFIERSHKQLLGDAPKTIASRMAAMVRSDANQEECEKFVRDTISSILRVTKEQVVRNLRRKRQKNSSDNASTSEGEPPRDK